MNSLGTQRLETSRIILRRATSDDAPAMYKNWVCDPEVTKYLTWSPYKSLDEAHDYIREQIERWEHDDSFYDWFIELKSIGEVIGTIGFVRSNLDIASFDVGYAIGRAWWGQGIVAEALAEVERFAFEEIGANRLVGQHDVNNPNSGKVMQKCGMTYEGTLRQAARNNQGIVDICQHSIIAADYFLGKSPNNEVIHLES